MSPFWVSPVYGLKLNIQRGGDFVWDGNIFCSDGNIQMGEGIPPSLEAAPMTLRLCCLWLLVATNGHTISFLPPLLSPINWLNGCQDYQWVHLACLACRCCFAGQEGVGQRRRTPAAPFGFQDKPGLGLRRAQPWGEVGTALNPLLVSPHLALTSHRAYYTSKLSLKPSFASEA